MTSKKNWHFAVERFGETALSSSSQTERIIFFAVVLTALASGLLLLWRVNSSFLVEVPEPGGTLKEGIVGIPRFINPVLEASDADKDMTALVYAGLLKTTPGGDLIPDAAAEYSLSENGRTYYFTLRDDLVFHDGNSLTTDDVEFTIQKIQDSTVKSPKRPAWNDVTFEKINSKEIAFTLKSPYAPFAHNFTVGILPKHIWRSVPADEFSFSEFNVNPIGSGPFRIKNIRRNSIGLPVYYDLRSFGKHALGEPFISRLITNFYQNEKDLLAAYKKGEVQSISGISPKQATGLSTESQVVLSQLPRVFGVFFNQNQATVFVNKEVREALSVAVDRERIVKEVLNGFGKEIDSPIFRNLNNVGEGGEIATEVPAVDGASISEKAIAILTKAGWSLDAETSIMQKKTKTSTTTLKFAIETSDVAELKQAAEIIADSWRAVGASVDVKIFETGDLNQNIIRPRKYDALFFGEVVSRSDFYPFWHSSQRNDPGLNIALYANISTDRLLEEMRGTLDNKARNEKLWEFEKIIKSEMPAAFVYSPQFIYVVPKSVKNVKLGELSNSGERFLNINEWYIDTNKVWKIFAK